MATQTRSTLKSQATTIKSETTAGTNTATRVGTELEDLVDSMALQVIQKTGTTITFEQDADYNSPSAPATGNITFDFTGAVYGTVVEVYHNHTSQPTLPTEAVARGSGSYVTGQVNVLQLKYVSNTRVEYAWN